MPAAETSCRVRPGPASGSGTSTTVRTSGPPNSVICTARMHVNLRPRVLVRTGSGPAFAVQPGNFHADRLPRARRFDGRASARLGLDVAAGVGVGSCLGDEVGDDVAEVRGVPGLVVAQ